MEPHVCTVLRSGQTLVTELRLKVNKLYSQASDDILRDTAETAQRLEVWIAAEAAGQSVLEVALAQVDVEQARLILRQAREMSRVLARYIWTLISSSWFKGDPLESWPLLRPALRLLLWLIPEHLPVTMRASVANQISTANHSAADNEQGETWHTPVHDWEPSFAQSLARFVATPTLASSLLSAARLRSWAFRDICILAPTAEGAHVLEESLVLMTLLSRFHTLAHEMDSHSNTASAADGAGQPCAMLQTTFLTQLAASWPELMKLLNLAFFWLQGCCKAAILRQETWVHISRAHLNGGMDDVAFAEWFKPSPELAEVAKLWESPVMVAHHLSLLLLSQPVHALAANAGHVHAAMLCFALPTVFTPGSRVSSDYTQQLSDVFQGHLMGLTLALRVALSDETRSKTWAHLSMAVPAITTAVDMIWFNMRRPVAATAVDPTGPSGLLHSPADAMLLRRHSFLLAQLCKADQALLAAQLQWEEQQRRWQQQQEGQHEKHPGSPHDAYNPRDWLGSAAAAAEALHFVAQVATHCGHFEQKPESAVQAQLLEAAFTLMRAMRPASPEAFAAGAPEGRGWALSLRAIATTLAPYRMTAQSQQVQPEQVPGDAMALKVLLNEVVPVLSHAASLAGGAAPATGWFPGTCRFEGPEADVVRSSTAVDDAAPAAGTYAAPAHGLLFGSIPAAQPAATGSAAPLHDSPTTLTPQPLGNLTLPVDSTLLLLGSSAEIVTSCIDAAKKAKALHSMLESTFHISSPGQSQLRCLGSGGTAGQAASDSGITTEQNGAALYGTGDVVTALEGVLSLAYVLVSGESLWQMARAQCPLLLIETLDITSRALANVMLMGVTDLRTSSCFVNDPLWSCITSWCQATMAQQEQHAEQYCFTSSANLGASNSSTVQDGGQLYIMGLMLELMIRLWEMLSDNSIKGQAQAPATWLPHADDIIMEGLVRLESILGLADLAVIQWLERMSVQRPPQQQPLQQQQSSSGSHCSSVSSTTTCSSASDASLQLQDVTCSADTSNPGMSVIAHVRPHERQDLWWEASFAAIAALNRWPQHQQSQQQHQRQQQQAQQWRRRRRRRRQGSLQQQSDTEEHLPSAAQLELSSSSDSDHDVQQQHDPTVLHEKKQQQQEEQEDGLGGVPHFHIDGQDTLLARQLTSLTPQLPWYMLSKAAARCVRSSDGWSTLSALQAQMCGLPLVRVVCMLAMAGRLSLQHEQGVVALIGGVPYTTNTNDTLDGNNNNSTSSDASATRPTSELLLLQEPAYLLKSRHEDGITLAKLATYMLGLDSDQQVLGTTRHLLSAFGDQQLPVLAAYYNTVTQLWTQGVSLYDYPWMRPVLPSRWRQGLLREVYLRWVQASLLKVIREVLNQPVCSAATSST